MIVKKLTIFSIFIICSFVQCWAMERELKQEFQNIVNTERFKNFLSDFNKSFKGLDWPIEKKSKLLKQLVLKYRYSAIKFTQDNEEALRTMNIIDSKNNFIEKDYIGIIIALQVKQVQDLFILQ